MKITALICTAVAAMSLAAAATAATPVVRDHRPVSPSSCPGGTVVNGKCATTVAPPRCTHTYYKCYRY